MIASSTEIPWPVQHGSMTLQTDAPPGPEALQTGLHPRGYEWAVSSLTGPAVPLPSCPSQGVHTTCPAKGSPEPTPFTLSLSLSPDSSLSLCLLGHHEEDVWDEFLC